MLDLGRLADATVHKMHNVHNDFSPMHSRNPFVDKELRRNPGQKPRLKKMLPACITTLVGLAVLAGCGQSDQITKYTVTKPEVIDPTLVARTTSPSAATTEQQTLGLIVPVDEMGWFFKLTGEKEAVQPQHEAFLQFVTSIKFSAGPNSKPTWTLPPGWKELPGREMRFATIQIAADGKPLELSVIPLPTAGGDTEKYVLDNVNRWRSQLNLKPIAAGELPATTKPLKIDGHDATLVSLVGTGGGGMAGAPFAPFAGGGAALPADHPPVTSDKATSGKSRTSAPIRYDAPPEWSAAPPNAFSIASFKVSEGDKKVEITISSAGGDLLSNVNRWRGQIGLSPIDAAELTKTVQKIDTLGIQGDYVELVGSETILGVRADAAGRTWFIKLKGDSTIASREKPRFEAFVKSLRLP
jgi:hypothetical protein